MASAIITTCQLCLFIYSAKVTSERRFECGADFSCVAKATTFVDKTLFIDKIIQKWPSNVLITAPKYFGKSTNVDMLKRFLEIEVDEEGTPKTKANYTRDPVTDTANYDMFVGKQLAIAKHLSVVEDHLGRHPVIIVNLRCGSKVTSYNASVECCKRGVHSAYLQHRYLLQSAKLSDHEKLVCSKWCDNSSYLLNNESDVRVGLNLLSGYLNKHFRKRKVFVLVDDYDYIITSAMFEVEDESVLQDIVDFNVAVFSDVMETFNQTVISQGLLTGAAYIDSMDWFCLTTVVKCRFLERHTFTEYYGLSTGDISHLFSRPEFTFDLDVQDPRQLGEDGFKSYTGRKVYSYRSIKF